MEIFDTNDKKYFDWMLNNPDGFVVNTFRSNNVAYSLLHKSGCRYISDQKGKKNGAFTERMYIKICSNSIKDLRGWFVTHHPKFTGQFKECKTCCPSG
jgi:hypothetical protein